MRWIDVCDAFPAQWLVIEALEDHVELVDGAERRVLDELAVIEVCADGRAAMHRCRELRHERPNRVLCCIHTSYPSLSFDDGVGDDRAGASSHA